MTEAPPPSHSPLLAGQVALVTGAARGLGLRIAERLGQEGALVLDTDHFSPIFTCDTLARCRRGRPPLVGLAGALRALSMVEAGYGSAGQGGSPVAVHEP